MKLTPLLVSIAVAWCLLGAIVLGPGVLVYPLAWGAVAAVVFAVHKVSQLRREPRPVAVSSATPARPVELSRDESAAVAR